ncbi:hypothetical protein EG328_009424 [Venturia inaequalis]|uniref:DUF4045 domain-containing protein n=1 Tax=Venturia inaequalis TaxID=5025 RepID=A0A8H3U8B8_VENIN|nr:hypothetical protein EG328_009424 [Venturia inaequalis]KAE9975686.1 hypothetical protein EG327_008383 [Venturia inaequalis]
MADHASEDLTPSEFVRNIHALGKKKDAEDVKRIAELESQILVDRQLRAQRRAERSRSLSPEKSPAAPNTAGVVNNSPADISSPSSQTIDAKKMSEETPASPATSTLSRSGTLSWQQRPKSSSGRRPLSMLAAENAAKSPRGTPEPNTAEEGQEPSRAQIAEALGSRDPSWFKQTADRGIGSAAYRKSQENLTVEAPPASGRTRLPGMSQESTVESESPTSPLPEETRSNSPSRASSVRGSAAWSASRYSNTTNASDTGSLRVKSRPTSTLMDAPKLDPPTLERDRRSPVSSRPPSPTKGMGGFVESAMMRRQDSVSKRWSQQAPPGLSRQSSTASNRNSYMAPSASTAISATRHDRAPSSLSRDRSLEPGGGSRPTSSHTNVTARGSNDSATENDRDAFVKPALPYHSRSKSVASISVLSQGSADPSSPSSPNKRWSPTKSSWLESALTKSEDRPATPTAPVSTQPSWMTELNKNRLSRSISPSKQLDTPELAKSIQSSEGKPEPAPTLVKPKSPPPIKAKSSPPPKARSPPPIKSKSPTISLNEKSPPPEPVKPFVLGKGKPEIQHKYTSSSPASSHMSSVKPSEKPAAAAGKFDFRANLKSRQVQNDDNGKTEPEFKNAIGKLKRAQTDKIAIPDPLKDNILRGKAGLSLTGGPAKREKVDELKDSLVKQKQTMQAKAASGETPKRPEKPANAPSTPEALAKRQALHRSQSSKDDIPATKSGGSTPEAIARMRSLKELKEKPKPVAAPQKSSSPSLPSKSITVSSNLDSALTRNISAEATPSTPLNLDAIPSKPSTEPALKSSVAEPKSQPFALPGMAKAGVSSKLADRFNPALLGVLARGPPSASPSSGPASKAVAGDAPPSSIEPLEHKTKGRAKGPKRRAPTKQVEESTVARTTAQAAPVAKPIHSPVQERTSDSSDITEKLLPSQATVGSVKTALAAFNTTKQPSTPVKHSRNSSASFPAISLVKTKDILPSSPRESHTFDRSTPLSSKKSPPVEPKSFDRSSSQSSLGSDKSPPVKPKTFSAIKSPLLSEFSLSPKADEPGNVPSERPTTPLHSLPQIVRVPSQEQETIVKPFGTRPLPAVPPKSPSIRDTAESPLPSFRTISPSIQQDQSTNSPLPSLRRAGLPTPPSTAPKDSPATPSAEAANVSVKNAASIWGRQTENTPSTPARVPSPVKLPTRRDEEKAMVNAGLMAPPDVPSLPKKPVGLGLGISDFSTLPASSVAKPADRSPNKLLLSPSLSADRAPDARLPRTRSTTITVQPKLSPRIDPNKTLPVPPESPVPHTSEANRMFSNFFHETPVVIPDEDMDTISILDSYPVATEKVKTVRKQLQEMTSDGRLSAVPSHQEHILFEDSMYLCTHTFDANGARLTEVCLWVGSGVPQAAVEDAQLFARTAARNNEGTLITIHQGEETPRFLEAIGGILIIFRGSRAKTSLGVPGKFVLCGRRHMGHICFDEVDFSLLSLFSGFPYLISTNSKLYLWKGVGCHQEELSSARLITMDVSTMPDLTEIVEGKEPLSFFTLFPALPKYPKNTVPRSADHWRLKARCEKYRCRLFRVEQTSTRERAVSLQVSNFFSNVIARRPSWSSLGTSQPQRSPTEEREQPRTPTTPSTPRTTAQAASAETFKTRIVEIAPFTQRDVDAERIYVLDAFFEVYIIIGPLAQSQSYAFATALLFAQDYGIIAAGMEDRPFVPISTVVLEGVPRDLKPCFRKWTDERADGGTEALMAGVKRGRSLRCVGLDAALAATRRDA